MKKKLTKEEKVKVCKIIDEIHISYFKSVFEEKKQMRNINKQAKNDLEKVAYKMLEKSVKHLDEFQEEKINAAFNLIDQFIEAVTSGEMDKLEEIRDESERINEDRMTEEEYLTFMKTKAIEFALDIETKK